MARRRKIKRIEVGQLIVLEAGPRWWICEPLSVLRVGGDFPTEMQAVMAAKELDELADWYGVVKSVSLGQEPNCRGAIEEIIQRFGGCVSAAKAFDRQAICQAVVAKRENSSPQPA